MTASAKSKRQLLLYEPRTEGHHLGWLRFITDDLLSDNFQLTIAADLRAGSRERVEQNLAGLLGEVKLISAYDANGRRHLDVRRHQLALGAEDGQLVDRVRGGQRQLVRLDERGHRVQRDGVVQRQDQITRLDVVIDLTQRDTQQNRRGEKKTQIRSRHSTAHRASNMHNT